MNIMLHILDKKRPNHDFTDPNLQNSYVAYTLDTSTKLYAQDSSGGHRKGTSDSVRYLSSLFKKYMTITLSNYINITASTNPLI